MLVRSFLQLSCSIFLLAARQQVAEVSDLGDITNAQCQGSSALQVATAHGVSPTSLIDDAALDKESQIMPVQLSPWVEIRSPSTAPQQADDYCISSIPANFWQEPPAASASWPTVHITAFEFALDPVSAIAPHHMQLFGCYDAVLHQKDAKCGVEGMTGNVCPEGDGTLIFAWAMHGERLVLPAGVGVTFGGDAGYRSFGLVVHHKMPLPNGVTDRSGFNISLASGPAAREAQALTLAPYAFSIPPFKKHVVISGGKDADVLLPAHEVTAMSYRVHAHALGVENVLRVNRPGVSRSVLSLRRSPQLPQSFVPFEKPIIIRKGDIVQFSCEYDSSNRSRTTYSGSTAADEMCNVYLLVHYDLKSSLGLMERHGAMTSSRSPALTSTKIGGLGTNMQVMSVSIAGSSAWVLTRGDRTWDSNTFVPLSNMLAVRTPITVDTIFSIGLHDGLVQKRLGGENLYLPHGIAAHPDGNSLWVTDVGRHQVLQIHASDGFLMRELGQRFQPCEASSSGDFIGASNNQPLCFCKPTDIAFSLEGHHMFVTDGYCNARVLKLEMTSYQAPRVIQHWGAFGSGQGQFNLPHAIAVGNRDPHNAGVYSVFVADRENNRIQKFSQDGEFEDILAVPNHPVYGVSVSPRGALTLAAEPGFIWTELLGESTDDAHELVWQLSRTKIVGTRLRNNITTPHHVASTKDGQILVAEYAEGQVQGALWRFDQV